jgi:hypothetical protein
VRITQIANSYKDLISLPFDRNNYLGIFAPDKRAVLQRLQEEQS